MDPLKTDRNQSAHAWIKRHFVKRECVCVCPTSKDSNKCGCGRYLASHYYFQGEVEGSQENPNIKWHINKCTATFTTQEFGTLSFQGVHGPNKSNFIRLDFCTDPVEIYHLLTDVWGYEPPKLVLTIQGGTNNFELSQNLTRALRKGLLKTAKTTNAWIITSGIRMGVVKQVVAALTETVYDRKAKFTIIGILPWGIMRRSEDLINSNGSCVPYYLQASSTLAGHSTGSTGRSRLVTLCENHSCFLLVDNGTFGRSGAELLLRRRFEDYLRQRPLGSHNGCRRLPLVCLVLGGGKSTVQSVLSYVTAQPPVPVVVCAGSGRAADILAFAKRHSAHTGEGGEKFKRQILRLVESSFGINEAEAHKIYKAVLLCSKWLNQTSVFSADKDESGGAAPTSANGRPTGDGKGADADLDHVILNTLLEMPTSGGPGHQTMSVVDKLGLLLTWNRDDMARQIFESGQHDDWPENSLSQAMLYALLADRVEFVQLLLNNGMPVDRFLTIARLEELYNTDRGPPNTLRFILQDVVKDPGPNYRFRLPHIGLIVEKLMGCGYRATYTRQDFRRKYKIYMAHTSKKQKFSTVTSAKANPDAHDDRKDDTRRFTSVHSVSKGSHFQYPFDELFLWAVLTKRHEMAMCMWRQGEEQLAKALVGFKLNKALAKEAEDDYLEVEVSQQFRNNAELFLTLAYDLLETCYQTDDDLTLQLLTYELKRWSRKTTLSLAAMSNFKKFVAHPCCQILLTDLWLGGLRIRRRAHLKVMLAILLPPAILFLQFKTQEQLLLQAQTAEEFHANRPELTADDEFSYASDSSSESDSIGDVEAPEDLLIDPKLSSPSVRSVGGAVAAGGTNGRCPSPEPDSPKALASRLSSVASGNLRASRKMTASATKSSLYTQCEAFECALLPGAGDSSINLNAILTPRTSADTAGTATLLVTNESESNTPLVGNRRFVHDRVANGLKTAGRSPTSLGFNILSRHSNKFHDDSFPSEFQRDMSIDIRKVSLHRNQELSRRKKIREFYQAPIACFWSFVICYIVFLASYTYIVLVNFPKDGHVTWTERFVVSFIFTFGCDQIRRVLLQEPNRLLSKWKVYVQQSTWDFLSCIACVMFLSAFLIRLSYQFYDDENDITVTQEQPPFNITLLSTSDIISTTNVSMRSSLLDIGRILYCCNIVFWYMRILHLLTVSSVLGPYITMYGKMVAKMFLLSNILSVVLVSFGVFRQAVLFPTEEWEWLSLRNITYKPYFMLYGELYAEEIDQCLDNNSLCVAGHFLVPLFMTIYLLLAIIVFVNMMIAAFNFVFMQVNSQSQIIWKFQRYEQVMEYEQQPFLPPPFIIITHICLIGKYAYRRIWRQDKIYRFEHSLKLFLSEAEVDKLHDFERECVESMVNKKQAQNLSSTDERVKQISEKLDNVSQKMDALFDRCNANRLLVLLLQDRLNAALGVPDVQLGLNGGGSGRRGGGVGGLNSWSGSAQDVRHAADDAIGGVCDRVTFPRSRQPRRSLTDIQRRESPIPDSYNFSRAALHLNVKEPGMSRSVTWSAALRHAMSSGTTRDVGFAAGAGDVSSLNGGTRDDVLLIPTIAGGVGAVADFTPLSRRGCVTDQSLDGSGIVVNLPGAEADRSQ